MYFTTVVVASLVVSVSSLAAPEVAGLSRRHHHAVLARRAPVAAPEPDAQPINASTPISKRRLRKRCKNRKSSSSEEPKATSPPDAPVNVAPPPDSSKDSPPPTNPSSADPAPPTKTSKSESKPASTPAPAPEHAPPPAPAPAPAPSPPPSNSGGKELSGDGTFYGTGLGSCGITSYDTDHIAAVSKLLYDTFPGYDGANPNNNPICGKKVTAHYKGKSVTVTIVDRCEGCAYGSLDFSPAAFKLLADEAEGRINPVTWQL